MRSVAKIVLAVGGALALGGPAFAAGQPAVHLVRVVMPDGTIRQIKYRGDTPPRIIFVPTRRVTVVDPVLFDPFRLMDRMAADMDRHFALTERRAAIAAAERRSPGRRNSVTAGDVQGSPARTVRYSFVSASNGRATCSRMIQISSVGADRPARVVSRTAGDCVGQAGQPATRVVARSRTERPASPVRGEKPKRPVQPRVDLRKTI